MSFTILLSACLSYCVIVVVTYVIIYGFSSHLFARIKVSYELVVGVVLGLISFFALLAARAIIKEPKNQSIELILQYLPQISFWISVVFISPAAAVGVLTINLATTFGMAHLVPDAIGPMPDVVHTITITIGYAFGCALLLINLFWKKLTPLFAWTFLSVLSLMVGLILLFAEVKNSTNDSTVELLVYVMWIGSSYFVAIMCFLINQIHSHAIHLRNIIEYENEYYVNQTSAVSEMQTMINKHGIRYGLVINFFISQFDVLDKAVSPAVRDFVMNNITTQVYQQLTKKYKNLVFFNTNYKTFGVFVPLNDLKTDHLKESYKGNNAHLRSVHDPLYNIARTFQGLVQDFRINNFRIATKVRAVASLYGIHSTNPEKLIENNYHYISNGTKLIEKNILYLVDPQVLAADLQEMRRIVSLNSIVAVNNASILYESVYNDISQDISGYFLNYIVNGDVVFPFTENVEQINTIKDYGLFSIFFRFLALKGLKAASKHHMRDNKKDLFLFYDVRFVSEIGFNIHEFMSKINKVGIKKEHLVLTFDIEGEVQSLEILRDNIVKLKRYGFRIALLNFGSLETMYNLIPSYQPDFLVLQSDIVARVNLMREARDIVTNAIALGQKIEATVVAANVKSFMIYKTLKDLGINYYFGDLIGSSTNMRDSLSNELAYLLKK